MSATHRPNEAREPPLAAVPETRAYLDLLHTHGCITTHSAEIYRRHGITEQQYQLLRILHAAGPGGLPCLEISKQLPTRVPDVTRLVDRVKRAGWVRRERVEADRRVVRVQLTERGWSLVERLEPSLHAFHRERLSRLTREELNELARLLRKARGEV